MSKDDTMGKAHGQRQHEERRNEQVACRTLPIGGGLAHQASSLAFRFARHRSTETPHEPLTKT